jgi:hypothetical protein
LYHNTHKYYKNSFNNLKYFFGDLFGLGSRLSAFSGKIIAEDVVIQISYRFGISGVIDIILELIAPLIAPLIAVRIMTT